MPSAIPQCRKLAACSTAAAGDCDPGACPDFAPEGSTAFLAGFSDGIGLAEDFAAADDSGAPAEFREDLARQYAHQDHAADLIEERGPERTALYLGLSPSPTLDALDRACRDYNAGVAAGVAYFLGDEDALQ